MVDTNVPPMGGGTWRGRPIDQLTRDELIVVVNTMGHMMQEQQLQGVRDMDMMQRLHTPRG